MAIEAVIRIKATEDEAAAIIRQAQTEVQEAVRVAEKDGQSRSLNIMNEARSAKQILMAQAESEAAEACALITAKGDDESTHILRPESLRFEEAVSVIVETIIKGVK